jgi:hypothetical protein
VEDKAPVVSPSAALVPQVDKMTQLERLLARIMQLIKNSPGQMITVTITIDNKGIPVCWQVKQGQVEGLHTDETVVK